MFSSNTNSLKNYEKTEINDTERGILTNSSSIISNTMSSSSSVALPSLSSLSPTLIPPNKTTQSLTFPSLSPNLTNHSLPSFASLSAFQHEEIQKIPSIHSILPPLTQVEIASINDKSQLTNKTISASRQSTLKVISREDTLPLDTSSTPTSFGNFNFKINNLLNTSPRGEYTTSHSSTLNNSKTITQTENFTQLPNYNLSREPNKLNFDFSANISTTNRILDNEIIKQTSSVNLSQSSLLPITSSDNLLISSTHNNNNSLQNSRNFILNGPFLLTPLTPTNNISAENSSLLPPMSIQNSADIFVNNNGNSLSNSDDLLMIRDPSTYLKNKLKEIKKGLDNRKKFLNAVNEIDQLLPQYLNSFVFFILF